MKISNKVLAFVLLCMGAMSVEGMISLADFVKSCNSAGEAPLVLGKTDSVSGGTDFEISGKRRQVEAKLEKVKNLAKANMMECEEQELDHDGSGKNATFVQHVTFVQWAQERIAAEEARLEEIRRKEEEEKAEARAKTAGMNAEAGERGRARKEEKKRRRQAEQEEKEMKLAVEWEARLAKEKLKKERRLAMEREQKRRNSYVCEKTGCGIVGGLAAVGLFLYWLSDMEELSLSQGLVASGVIGAVLGLVIECL